MTSEKQTVLVTGASGFIARHCIIRLLEQGYMVRGSLRTPGRANEVRNSLAAYVDTKNLTFVTLDLMSDEGWSDALKDCDFLMHMASPFPAAEPKDENEIIAPAREGTLRALKAAAEAGVRRTVITSSLAAIAYGHEYDEARIFTEDDWSNLDGKMYAYLKSKTIAERAAWDFIASDEAKGMEMAAINPGAVLGPLLDKEHSFSGELVRKLLAREMPACPRLAFNCVDVRDIADAHLAAMVNPSAAGRRYICVGSHAWMLDISKILNVAGYKTPTRKLPDFMVHIIALFDKSVRMIKGGLGRTNKVSNRRMREELGIEPRSLEEMTLAMAKTMVEFGVVKA